VGLGETSRSPRNAAALRAERHSDRNLMTPERDRERDYGVDASDRQHERCYSERGNQIGIEAPRRLRRRHHISHGLDRLQGELRIELSHRLAQGLSHLLRSSAASKHDVVWPWVFASKRYRGRGPYRGQAILRANTYVQWRRMSEFRSDSGGTLFDTMPNSGLFRIRHRRHTYSTLLRSVGTEFKVMQELLRHSSFRSTLDVYTQAVTPAKHAPQAAVMSLVFSDDANGG
jgi:hypothetical protein